MVKLTPVNTYRSPPPTKKNILNTGPQVEGWDAWILNEKKLGDWQEFWSHLYLGFVFLALYHGKNTIVHHHLWETSFTFFRSFVFWGVCANTNSLFFLLMEGIYNLWSQVHKSKGLTFYTIQMMIWLSYIINAPPKARQACQGRRLSRSLMRSLYHQPCRQRYTVSCYRYPPQKLTCPLKKKWLEVVHFLLKCCVFFGNIR